MSVRSRWCLPKRADDFKQVPLNVLKGEPKTPEHRERHPFGKVPVLDHDGMRILETTAITRYLNDVLPGKSLIPSTPKDRARMDMVIGLIDSYGYGALMGGVAAYHLFPDFVGGKNETMRKGGLENGRKMIELAMKTKGSSPFIAGDLSKSVQACNSRIRTRRVRRTRVAEDGARRVRRGPRSW